MSFQNTADSYSGNDTCTENHVTAAADLEFVNTANAR